LSQGPFYGKRIVSACFRTSDALRVWNLGDWRIEDSILYGHYAGWKTELPAVISYAHSNRQDEHANMERIKRGQGQLWNSLIVAGRASKLVFADIDLRPELMQMEEPMLYEGRNNTFVIGELNTPFGRVREFAGEEITTNRNNSDLMSFEEWCADRDERDSESISWPLGAQFNPVEGDLRFDQTLIRAVDTTRLPQIKIDDATMAALHRHFAWLRFNPMAWDPVDGDWR
jgi:hypothetical protein